ncbi:MAG: PrgI family protein [Dysosmobacter sp.]
MEVRINKEVRNYQESLFFGLSLRQLLFALLAVTVAVGVYFGLRPVLGNGEVGWVCVLAAFPFALGGFFQYNGMTLERFLLAYIRSEFLFPRRLVFKSDNIYAKALENSTIWLSLGYGIVPQLLHLYLCHRRGRRRCPENGAGAERHG